MYLRTRYAFGSICLLRKRGIKPPVSKANPYILSPIPYPLCKLSKKSRPTKSLLFYVNYFRYNCKLCYICPCRYPGLLLPCSLYLFWHLSSILTYSRLGRTSWYAGRIILLLRRSSSSLCALQPAILAIANSGV